MILEKVRNLTSWCLGQKPVQGHVCSDDVSAGAFSDNCHANVSLQAASMNLRFGTQDLCLTLSLSNYVTRGLSVHFCLLCFVSVFFEDTWFFECSMLQLYI